MRAILSLVEANSFETRRRIIAELRGCRSLEWGKTVHAAAEQTGNDCNIFVASTLINMYGECGSMEDARGVFDKLTHPDAACWNALILGYANNGQADVALDLFSSMASRASTPDPRTFVAASVACSQLAVRDEASARRGRALHSLAKRYGCGAYVFLQNNLVDLYGKCGAMDDAFGVFGSIVNPDVVAWTALVFGYADNGQGITALELFSKMDREGCAPNARTFVAALKACADLAAQEGDEKPLAGRVKRLHLLSQLYGCDADVYVQGSLVDMYSKCRNIDEARLVFDRMKLPDVVCWTALVFGYAENGESESALCTFSRMRQHGCLPDAGCFVAAFKACGDLAVKEQASVMLAAVKALHLLALRTGCDSDDYVKCILVDVYAKCGSMQNAQEVFDSVKSPDVACWNALIFGYAANGEAETALDLFSRIDCAPDAATFVAALKACITLGAAEIAKTLQSDIRARGFDSDPVLRNCLIDVHAKFGRLVEAEQLIALDATDLVPWNSLIAGYSRNGDSKSALSLFGRMRDRGIRPDGITLKCILTACAHAGLVQVGKVHFEAMCTKYEIKADIEHYNCMLDLLGRAKELHEMMLLLRSMQLSPNAVTWTTVLSACRKWKNVELGELAFESLISLENADSGAYVLMSNIYDTRNLHRAV